MHYGDSDAVRPVGRVRTGMNSGPCRIKSRSRREALASNSMCKAIAIHLAIDAHTPFPDLLGPTVLIGSGAVFVSESMRMPPPPLSGPGGAGSRGGMLPTENDLKKM
jgi:hypothetical protein